MNFMARSGNFSAMMPSMRVDFSYPPYHQLCENGDRAEVRQRNWAAAMAGTYFIVFGMASSRWPSYVLWGNLGLG
jgi:hypothetical protein